MKIEHRFDASRALDTLKDNHGALIGDLPFDPSIRQSGKSEMMSEPTDLELIDHFLGRNPPDLCREIEAALETSPELRQRYNELAGLWRLLGEAEVDLPRKDLWPALVKKLDVETRRPTIRSSSPTATWWAAAAASVAVAALVGYGSARLRVEQSSEVLTASVKESEVITQLELSAFDSGSVGQLGKSLIEDQSEGSSET